jgi:C-3',4' desaturase CrtD
MTNTAPSQPSAKIPEQQEKVIVIGGGIGGLTAGALLAHRGYQVTIFDQAIAPGGCASTFQRRGFTFDVGATQVAGLEPGGIHYRIFQELGIDLPEATPCDPACAVFLLGETEPVNVWREPAKWQAERLRQFPGSEKFWQFLDLLFDISWRFQERDPVLPPANLWDVGQLIQAIRLDTLLTVPFTLMTVADALRLFGLSHDQRLKTFLDLQLKLYSQVKTDETALLYAATALGVSQLPQGLSHLQGSMQVLSDHLVTALKRDGGQLFMRHTVETITTEAGKVTGVTVRSPKNEVTWHPADQVVANVTVQNLVTMVNQPNLVDSDWLTRLNWSIYRQRVNKLINPSSAFVIYLGVKETAIPANCPPHLQFFYDYDGPIGENNSLFVSVSHAGDGRSPAGCATVIASSFTNADLWFGDELVYEDLKVSYTNRAIARLGEYFQLTAENIIHQEAATPRTFQRYTGRLKGFVGGVGQRVKTFGPFGIGNRTPLPNLWLVGDSTHPGEGTAGVSYSALTVVKQIING